MELEGVVVGVVEAGGGADELFVDLADVAHRGMVEGAEVGEIPASLGAFRADELTAMGRASAYVLVGVPFFMLGTITLLSPEYMDPLYHSSTGHKLLVLGLVMISVGSLMLRKIVSFRG